MPQDCFLSLTVYTGTDGGYRFHLNLDECLIANNAEIKTADAERLRKFADVFGALFDGDGVFRLSQEGVAILGRQLFELWLSPRWRDINAAMPPGCTVWFIIASELPEILNLPWELTSLPNDKPIGADSRWCLRRFPFAQSMPASSARLRAGPLRVLFIACQPEEAAQLDFEKEEQHLYEAFAKVGPNAVFDSCDLGTYDELGKKIDSFCPHIVHFTGHGIVKDGQGWLNFESDSDDEDLRSAVELGQLFAGSDVQCAFISGCQTGKAPDQEALGGICQSLVRAGVPLAIGWAASISDRIALGFAETFYDRLAAGVAVNRALNMGRQAARQFCEKQRDLSWALPVLYSLTRQNQLLDSKLPQDAPERQSLRLQALPGMTDGHADDFIGRRREQKRLLPALRDGKIQGLVLTGIGGVGKSTLATRLARKLQAEGFTPIAVSARARNPLDLDEGREPITAARLIEAVAGTCFDVDNEKDHAKLQNPTLEVTAKLRHVVTILNKGRFVLLLDNLETNMDEATREIRDRNLEVFLQHLASHLAGDSRVIVTSRYLPKSLDPTPSYWREWTLCDFPEVGFVKFMLRDPEIERRCYIGELQSDIFHKLHACLGGLPRFMEQIRKVLHNIDEMELKAELATIDLSSADDQGRLKEARDDYCQKIFTTRLYDTLSDEAKTALARAAVMPVPVTLEGLAITAGVTLETIRDAATAWQRAALAYSQPGPKGELWSVYGMLRAWLTTEPRLSASEQQTALRAAGKYLVELDETDRESELRLHYIDCRLVARSLFLSAGAIDLARKTTSKITGFLLRQGLSGDVECLNRELLDIEEHATPLLDLGRSYLKRSGHAEARTCFKRALTLMDLDEDPSSIANVHHQLATVDMGESKYEEAHESFKKALSIRQEIEDQFGEGETLCELATIDIHEARYHDARNKLETALLRFQTTGNPDPQANAWHQLATIDKREGKYDEARKKFETALSIKQDIDDPGSEAATLHQLGSIDLEEKRYDYARKKLEKALSIFRSLHDLASEGSTWHQLATIDMNQGDNEEARKKFEIALTISRTTGNRAGEAGVWHQLGFLARARSPTREQQSGALKLFLLSYGIDVAIGHGAAEHDLQNVAALASMLDYTTEQIDGLLDEVGTSYKNDGGLDLYREAFGEELLAKAKAY